MVPTDGRRAVRRGRAAWIAAAAGAAALAAASPATGGEPLRPVDLPADWRSIDAPPARLFAGLCDLRPRPKAQTVLHSRYSAPRRVPIVDSTWYRFATVRLARARFAAIRRELRTCRTYLYTRADGEQAVVTVEPAGAPAFGDEAVAYARVLVIGAGGLDLRSAVMRVGRRIASVHVLDLSPPDPALLDGLAARAAALA
jgi:hypothetical protein